MSREGWVRNIGAMQCRRRLILGIVGIAVGAAGMAVLLTVDVDRLWRLALFIPLWAGFLGFFQHQEKT
ncbi:MAG: hypothetical protein R3314_14775 [Longimicrobiales bacterium]|nr:hypothetical protein [Longimicrobiales bacterium]